MKYLLVLLLVVIAWHIWRGKRVENARPAHKKTLAQPEPMAHCSHCGVHFPQSDAISHRGKHYCSQAHLAAATDTASSP